MTNVQQTTNTAHVAGKRLPGTGDEQKSPDVVTISLTKLEKMHDDAFAAGLKAGRNIERSFREAIK